MVVINSRSCMVRVYGATL